MREYKTIRALRNGEIIELASTDEYGTKHALKFKMAAGEIVPGDLYIAERNTGPKLLTALIVDSENGWIQPVDTLEYSYDIGECVKVEEA